KAYQAGRPDEAARRWADVLELEHLLYPRSRHPDGHIQLVITLEVLGTAFVAAGEAERGLGHMQQALAMCRKLFPDGRTPEAGLRRLASCLLNVGSALRELGRYTESLDHFGQALALHEALYPKDRFPDGNERLAVCLNNVGVGQRALGRYEDALVSQ